MFGLRGVEATEGHDPTLMVRIGTCTCALPLAAVIETMRPLPVEPVAGAPAFVRGLSIIRGIPVPVFDASFLVAGVAAPPKRFVTLRAGARIVALAVDAVLGVRALDSTSLSALPPLLGEAAREAILAIGTLDAQLLVVLDAARLVPDDVFALLEGAGR